MNNTSRYMPVFSLVLELYPEERARFPEKFEVRVVSSYWETPVWDIIVWYRSRGDVRTSSVGIPKEKVRTAMELLDMRLV